MKATFGQRLLAYLVDSVVVGSGIAFVVGLFVAALGLPASLARPGALVAWWAYMCACTARGGQTAGKKALRIRVVLPDGTQPGWGQVVLRETLGRAVSGLIFGLGYLWMLWDGERRCLHDVIAGTRVVRAG